MCFFLNNGFDNATTTENNQSYYFGGLDPFPSTGIRYLNMFYLIFTVTLQSSYQFHITSEKPGLRKQHYLFYSLIMGFGIITLTALTS